MILAIDIGNTNIVLGCVDNQKTYFIERLATNKTKMELEYAIDIKMVLDIHEIDVETLDGAIICSVVPQITYVVKEAAEKILKRETLVIGPGVKTGLNILIDNPSYFSPMQFFSKSPFTEDPFFPAHLRYLQPSSHPAHGSCHIQESHPRSPQQPDYPHR